jgi:excisionase family DNA binding protein
MSRTVFTLGQVAKLCGVSHDIVSRWCKSGGLPHFTVRDSRDRRVGRDDLATFLKEKNLADDLQKLETEA